MLHKRFHKLLEPTHFYFAKLKATPGFEPGDEGFADPCLTTWLCRRIPDYRIKLSQPCDISLSGRRREALILANLAKRLADSVAFSAISLPREIN